MTSFVQKAFHSIFHALFKEWYWRGFVHAGLELRVTLGVFGDVVSVELKIGHACLSGVMKKYRFCTGGDIMFFLIACQTRSEVQTMYQPLFAPEISTADDTCGDSGTSSSLTHLATRLTQAWLEEMVVVTSNDEWVGANYYLSHPGDTLNVKSRQPNGTTPDNIDLESDDWCVDFTAESTAGTRYVSAVVCEVGIQTSTLETPLCVDLSGDWICEDIWGVEGTPDTFYTSRDVTMQNGCEVQLFGITWGSQHAHVDGHSLTADAHSYTVVGVISEDGQEITFKIDFGEGQPLDYWSTCQKLY